MTDVRTRFAPSPTGELHIGGLRTALYAWLHARHHGGAFAIRVEDTDRARLVPGSAERMLDALRRCGITWDEGPDIGGPHAPYVQSERLDRYRAAADSLVAQGSAYRCDCSPTRLQELRDAQTAAKQPTRYDQRCRTRDVPAATPHVVRFRMPEEGSVSAEDIIHRRITVPVRTLDDFVLLKTDGFPTYHLAHVVDDHEMRTSHVIRGDEWLPSLPKHVLLFRAFHWDPPQYAHLPLLLNTQRQKLSKRDGDTDIAAFLRWCLPEALVNFVALLGWNPSDDREQYTIAEFIAAFDLAHVNRSPAAVDFQKLEWLNGRYIRQRSPTEVAAAMRAAGVLPSTDADFLLRVLTLEQTRLKRLDALPPWYFAPVDLRSTTLSWKRTPAETTRRNLAELRERLRMIDDWPETPQELEAIVKSWLTEHGLGVGETLWPMRVALSGQAASPSPFELAWLFGKEETIRRFSYALEQLREGE